MQEDVLAEANMMIPNTTQRLSSALEDLVEVKVGADESRGAIRPHNSETISQSFELNELKQFLHQKEA